MQRAVPDVWVSGGMRDDFGYEKLEHIVDHVDLVGRGRVVGVREGAAFSDDPASKARLLVVEVTSVIKGRTPGEVLVPDGSWIRDGVTHGVESRPWLVEGDEVFLLAFENNGIYYPTSLYGLALASAPSAGYPSGILPPREIDSDEFERLLREAASLVASGEVDWESPEERLARIETWTSPPEVLGTAKDVAGAEWRLWAAPTVDGFCYQVVPSTREMDRGTGCLTWETTRLMARNGPIAAPVVPEGIELKLALFESHMEQLRREAQGDGPVQLIERTMETKNGRTQALTIILKGQ